jgi:hypothetical protein
MLVNRVVAAETLFGLFPHYREFFMKVVRIRVESSSKQMKKSAAAARADDPGFSPGECPARAMS